MSILVSDWTNGNGITEDDFISEGSMPSEPTRPLLDPDTPEWFVHFADTWFMNLARDVSDLKDSERRNNKLLRGENGTPGVVARFDITEKRVDALFSTGAKILFAVATGTLGVMFFIITTVLGVIIYHVLTSP